MGEVRAARKLDFGCSIFGTSNRSDIPAFTNNHVVCFTLSYSIHCTRFHIVFVLLCCEERRRVLKRATALNHSASARSLRHGTTDVDRSKELRDVFTVSAHIRFKGSLVLLQRDIIQKTASQGHIELINTQQNLRASSFLATTHQSIVYIGRHDISNFLPPPLADLHVRPRPTQPRDPLCSELERPRLELRAKRHIPSVSLRRLALR